MHTQHQYQHQQEQEEQAAAREQGRPTAAEQVQQGRHHRSSPASISSSSPSYHGQGALPHPGAPSPMLEQNPRNKMNSFLEEPRPLMMQQTVTTNDLQHHQRQRRRKEFALLIKILLKVLWDAKEVSLYHQVRLSIATCTKRNRMGDPSFSPLEDVLEAHLWMMVGDTYWDKATNLQQKYLQRKEFLARPDPSLRLLQAYQDMQLRRIVQL